MDLFSRVKQCCGISQGIKVYDSNISTYIQDAILIMLDSGVPQSVIDEMDEQTKVTISFHVHALIFNDSNEMYKYEKLFKDRVFRLTLHGDGETDV